MSSVNKDNFLSFPVCASSVSFFNALARTASTMLNKIVSDLVNFMLSGSGIFEFFYIFFEVYSMIYLNSLKIAG